LKISHSSNGPSATFFALNHLIENARDLAAQEISCFPARDYHDF